MQLSRVLSLLALVALLASQGCLAAAVGYGAYAVSSSKDEATQKEAEARHIQTYNTYKADAEKLNFDREKSGLKPQPVMTFPEWKLAHNITTPAPTMPQAAGEKK
ncbi:MAG: hypothetical protein NTY36_03955 [Deltaproteobacteria bacterium]|nr:hypothetical protein [Deltaproteobacteria bacterium]